VNAHLNSCTDRNGPSLTQTATNIGLQEESMCNKGNHANSWQRAQDSESKAVPEGTDLVLYSQFSYVFGDCARRPYDFGVSLRGGHMFLTNFKPAACDRSEWIPYHHMTMTKLG